MSEQPELVYDDGLLGGVWANHIRCVASIHEVTIDFFRTDFSRDPFHAVLVARVGCSRAAAANLANCLDPALRWYLENEMQGDT